MHLSRLSILASFQTPQPYRLPYASAPEGALWCLEMRILSAMLSSGLQELADSLWGSLTSRRSSETEAAMPSLSLRIHQSVMVLN